MGPEPSPRGLCDVNRRSITEVITDFVWVIRIGVLSVRGKRTKTHPYQDHPLADEDGWVTVDLPDEESEWAPAITSHDETGRIVTIEFGSVDDRRRGVLCGVTNTELPEPCEDCEGAVFEEVWLWETVDRVLDGVTTSCEGCGAVWFSEAVV